MVKIFQHRWISSFAVTAAFTLMMLLFTGGFDIRWLLPIFILSAVGLSYPGFSERLWQSRNLPPDAIHVPVSKLKQGNDVALLDLFLLPQVYALIKNRYSLKLTDASAPGLFLYVYLPAPIYEMRNTGADSVYRSLATRLKSDVPDSPDLDLITQRNLPLSFGFRFLPKHGFAYPELSDVIDVVKKDYFRENTRIRGILQSKQRMFRVHAPDDGEWRTFVPYQEETSLLHGGTTVSHDFRSKSRVQINYNEVPKINAEKVHYPETIPFGSLLTYAKKGEISLEGVPMAVDKLYIDRMNVLLNGSAHRQEILKELGALLKRDVTEDDFYPLFNYGHRLQGYMEPGKNVSDFVSSRGNFAIYYDSEKGWTIVKLEKGLELKLVEAYWNHNSRPIQNPTSLTTSRAKLITGAADSLLSFQISTGTPTRGQILTADELIESKVRSFSQVFDFHLLQPVGSGAEGCIYLAEKDSKRYYLKSPDGQLAQEEINTIESLKRAGLIPQQILTYPDERMIVLPEFQPLPELKNGMDQIAVALIFRYLEKVWQSGFLCIDLTPDHVKLDANQQKLFLIDFSGYSEQTRFRRSAKELIADRKKIEYRTPEEQVKDFRDAEKLQIYLLGLLMHQLLRNDQGLPAALKELPKGSFEYDRQLEQDLQEIPNAAYLKDMLAYDPAQRKTFLQLQDVFPVTEDRIQSFWKIFHE